MKKMILTLGLALAASSSLAATKQLPLGTYAGKGINLTVTSSGVTYELGCSNGAFLRPKLGANGAFNLTGTQVSEVMSSVPQTALATRVTGQYSSPNILSFDITLIPANPSGVVLQPVHYDLQKGPLQILTKCK